MLFVPALLFLRLSPPPVLRRVLALRNEGHPTAGFPTFNVIACPFSPLSDFFPLDFFLFNKTLSPERQCHLVRFSLSCVTFFLFPFRPFFPRDSPHPPKAPILNKRFLVDVSEVPASGFPFFSPPVHPRQ